MKVNKSKLIICIHIFLIIVFSSLSTVWAGVETDTIVSTNWIQQTETGTTNYFAGKVGIGTNDPSAELHVTGSVQVDGIMTVPKQGDVNMGIYTNGLSAGGASGGGGTTNASAVNADFASPTNYTPGSANVDGHLMGIDAALASAGGGGGSSTSVCFRAYCSTNFDIAASSTRKVPIDAEMFDMGSDYDLATNKCFNAPDTGIYIFTVKENDTTTGVGLENHLYTNGVLWLILNGNNNDELGQGECGTTGPVLLNNGDYVEWYIKNSSGSIRTVEGGTINNWFSGYQLK